MYTMPMKKKNNKTRRIKQRPDARGLMQSRPRNANDPPRAQDAVTHRLRNPPKKTLRGKVPGHMEGDLAALGITAYGSAVSTHNPRMMAAEDRGIDQSSRRALGKHRRGPKGLAETQKAFTGLLRTNSGSSGSSFESYSPQHRPGQKRHPWNPLDSYGESPPAKSSGHATRRKGGRKRKHKTKRKTKRRTKRRK